MTQERPVYLVGAGASLAPFRYTNAELAPYYNVSQESAARYAEATGVYARYSCVDLADGRRQKVLCEDLATEAARMALAAAGMRASEIQCVVTSASMFDYLMPTIGARLLKRLGITEAMTFDLYGGCAQFLHGVVMAANYVRSGMLDRVLVTASETLTSWSRSVRYPVDAFIFGDGGGAWILTAEPPPNADYVFEIHDTTAGTVSEFEGELTEVIVLPFTGLGKEDFDQYLHNEVVDERMSQLLPDETRQHMRWQHNNKLVRRAAPFGLIEGFKRVTRSGGPTPGVVIPHQATVGVLDEAQSLLPDDWALMNNLHDRGNMSTCCVPVTFCDRFDEVAAAETVVATSVGVGFSFAAAKLTPVSRPAQLAPLEPVRVQPPEHRVA